MIKELKESICGCSQSECVERSNLILALETAIEALEYCASDERECGRNSYGCCGKCRGIYQAEEALTKIESMIGGKNDN